MNTLPNLIMRKRVPYKFYIFVVLTLSLSMAFYVFPEALDITRYYEMAEDGVSQFSGVVEYAEYWFEMHLDFIYGSSLFLLLKMGLPLNIATIFYLSLYYICVFEILRRHFPNLNIAWYILFYVAMYAPFIWVQSISRNLAAISFFYLAMLFLLDGKKVKFLFCLFLSIFTHISMVMYVPIIFVAYFLEKRDINEKIIGFSIVFTLILSFISPSQLLNLLSFLLEGSDMRYAASYSNIQAQGALQDPNIGYGDKLPIVFCLFYAILLLFINKRKDLMYWMLYVLTLMLSFFVFSSLMFTNRVIMLMTLFVAYNAYNVMRYGTLRYRNIIKISSLVGCLIVFLHFYSYRTSFAF